MEPIFTMQYAEFAVADFLSKKIKFEQEQKSISVFIPSSAQEKGIDLLLYHYDKNESKSRINSIQVKMSRTYYSDKKDDYPYTLLFNRFEIQDNADWYILVGIYAKHSNNPNAKANSVFWNTVMLAFTKEEMRNFMNSLKQKKDPSKDDRMFYFSFNVKDEKINIFQTRGCGSEGEKDMNGKLVDKRLEEIKKSFH